jgi:MFS family permease
MIKTTTKNKAWLVWALVSVFLFIDCFLQSVGNMITDPIMRDFHITNAGLGLLNSVFFWSYLLMQIPGGVLLDRLGTRKTMIPALLCIAFGAMFFAISSNIYVAILGRLLMGLGSAFGFIGLLFVITQWFPRKSIHFVFGLGILFSLLASSLAQHLGPMAVTHLGWRFLFWIILVVGLILSGLMFFMLEDREKHKATHIVLSMKVFLLESLSALVRERTIWFAGIFGFGALSIYTVFTYLWAVPFFQNVYGLPYLKATDLVVWLLLGCAFGSPFLGWINKKTNQPKILMLVSMFVLFVATAIVIVYAGLPMWLLSILLFIMGALASINILGSTISGLSVHHNYQGTAIACCNMIGMMGSVIFQPIVGHFIDSFQKHGVSAVHTYQYALLVLPILLVISFIMVFGIKIPDFSDEDIG